METRYGALLIVGILLTSLTGCSRLYQFEGVVVDGDGNPISAALVCLRPHDWPARSIRRPASPRKLGAPNTSDNDGTFEATWGNAVGVEFFTMAVIKDGFKDNTQTVPADAKDIRVAMERESPNLAPPAAR